MSGITPTSVPGATNYYAAPNGSAANTGLSTNSPWTLTYALANAGASTIMLMDGNYTDGPYTISTANLTVKAINKWGPKFNGIAGGNGIFEVLAAAGGGVVLDGLAFSNCQYQVLFRHGLTNCVARNLWVAHTGDSFGGTSGSASGITVEYGTNNMVENCLCEYNGTVGVGTAPYNHGIYCAGVNGIYRNNVCRYNGGLGMSVDGHGYGADVGNQIYNNLMYGNTAATTSGAQIAPANDTSSAANPPNLIFGNTFISTTACAIACQNASCMITNNIVISTGYGILLYNTGTVYADYNLAPQAISTGAIDGHNFAGPHDVVSSNYGFVNSSKGLYWLTTNSAAYHAAQTTACGAVDFFGNPQSSVSDLGAFQYNPTYTTDSRVMDPSAANSDYWTKLGATNGGRAAITVSPANQDFGSIPVGSTADATFTLQNLSSATVSGSASVSAPFSIVSGGSYNLGAGVNQVVTVRYSPTTLGSDSATVTFSGGAGATVGVSGTATALPPVVSSITPSAPDVDPAAPGVQVYEGASVQYSGSASDPGQLPLTWQWIYTVNGGPEVTALSGSGMVSSVSFNYAVGTAGNAYVWKLRVNNGSASAESTLNVGVEAAPPPGVAFSIQASAGNVSGPFVVTNGYLYQPVSTDLTTGGQALYNFTVPNDGSYVFQALVNAPSIGSNSFYLNVDGQPQDPGMIWDVPVTSRFERRSVSWRGSGTDTNDQFVPATFSLSAGGHQLVIVGREANTQLEQLWIVPCPTPPQNLRIVTAH